METKRVGVFENHKLNDSTGFRILTLLYIPMAPRTNVSGKMITVQNKEIAKNAHQNTLSDCDAVHRSLWAFDSPEPDSHLIRLYSNKNRCF